MAEQPAPPITCTPKSLPREQWVPAAEKATEVNPMNHPPVERLTKIMKDFTPDKGFVSVLTTKFWHTNGVRLGVRFLDNPPADLRSRIIGHMNAWSATANVSFWESEDNAQVRIARQSGDQGGYWSYLGTDILSIAADQPTMNLEAFSMSTPESEYHRVVRHETGHTLGFPHEHMRRELVDLIDRDAAIAYFQATQGWSPAETIAQVLTPIEESSLRGTAHADPNSIMCYQIPGNITKDHHPIPGGLDIDPSDSTFCASCYPKPAQAAQAPGA